MIAYRGITGSGLVVRPAARFVRWLFSSREYTNFTYELGAINVDHLAAFVAAVTGTGFDEARRFIDELEADEGLRRHIRDTTARSDQAPFADSDVHYGRRLGWYAIVRAMRPALVVETGVDKGLGSCVLCAALLRNIQDGHPGRYVGTDINPAAGYLLSGAYADVGEIRFGDSIETLRTLAVPIDVFINDSDHSSDYERREYETVEARLSAAAIVIGDNAHETNELLSFARRTGRRFLFFAEQPHRHWYPGAGIGAAWDSSAGEAATKENQG